MKNIAVIMGSKSDWSKLAPKMPEELQIDFSDVDFGAKYTIKSVGGDYQLTPYVSSADREPHNTEHILRSNTADVVICAAGLNNQLAALAKKTLGYTNREIRLSEREPKPVIAVPVYDSGSGGVSSFLSTIEKPKGYSIPTTPVNGIDVALQTAYQIEKNNWTGIDLIPGMLVDDKNETVIAAEKTLAQLFKGSGIPSETKRPIEIDPERLSLLVFNNIGGVYDVDNKSDFVIATKTGTIEDVSGFVKNAGGDGINNTLFVGATSGASLAYAAAEIFAEKNQIVRENLIDFLDEQKRNASVPQKLDALAY